MTSWVKNTFRKLGKQGIQLICKIVYRRKVTSLLLTPESKVGILILKPLGFGDYFMNSVHLQTLCTQFPKATILTDYTFKTTLPASVTSIKSIADCRALDTFDIVIVPNKNLRQSWYSLFIPKTHIVGYLHDWTVRSTFGLPGKTFTPHIHFYDMCRFVNEYIDVVSIEKPMCTLIRQKKDISFVRSLIKNRRPYVIVNPFVAWESRMWSMDGYKKVIEYLVSKKYTVCVTGTAQEIEHCKSCLVDNPNCISLFGKTTLETYAEICKHAHLFIGGDCGPMHIAISERTPTLTLWGVTRPEVRIPLHDIGKRHRVIYDESHLSFNIYDMENEPMDDSAIKSIAVSQVLHEVKKIL